jgi:hypothetical protein
MKSLRLRAGTQKCLPRRLPTTGNLLLPVTHFADYPLDGTTRRAKKFDAE